MTCATERVTYGGTAPSWQAVNARRQLAPLSARCRRLNTDLNTLEAQSSIFLQGRRASGRRLLRCQQLLSPQLGLFTRARVGGNLRGGGPQRH